MSRTCLLPGWGLALLFLAGCAGGAADARDGAVTPAEVAGCDADADCPPDLTCLLPLRACSAPEALPYRIAINVLPPETDADGLPTSLVQTQWADLEPGEVHERNLTLQTPLVLEGSIDLLGLGNACYVPTGIVATATADIAGWLDYRFTGTLAPDDAADGWRYRLAVLPDRWYRLAVFIGVAPGCTATDAVYPPVVLERFVSNQPGRAEIPFVAPPLAEALQGTLRFDDGAPVAGVRLVAASLDGGTTFAASETDASGGFRLRLPQGMTEFALTAHPTAAFPQFPVQDLDGWFAAGDAARDGLDLVVPTLPAAADAHVTVTDRAGRAEPEVRLTLTGQVAGGLLTLSTTSDANGQALLRAFPGTYTLLAEPAEGAPVGATVTLLSLGADRQDARVVVPDKQLRHVSVLSETSGAPVAGADVYATLVSLPGDPAAVERRYHLVSDSSGAVEAHLEPGVWRLLVVPPSVSGLPRWSEAGVIVSAAEPADLTLTLPAPWLLHGRVVDPDGRPVQNAAVEVLGQAGSLAPEGDASLAGQGYNERGLAAVAGQTVTDAEGRFLLALPFSNQ